MGGPTPPIRQAQSGRTARAPRRIRPTVESMSDERTFAVTLVRAGRGLPTFEVGAYRYTAEWLPVVGDVITITKAASTDADDPEQLLAYVTRVNPNADTPIRATEATVTISSPDDYIVAA
jgi:hypothetical protein